MNTNVLEIHADLLSRAFRVVLAALLLVVVGCQSPKSWVNSGYKVGPNYARRAAPVSDGWIDYEDPRIQTGSTECLAWWTAFDDPKLNRIIDTMHQQNLTLREAGFRVMEFQAQRDVVTGNLFPQQQNLDGNYTRSQTSGALGFGSASNSRWRFGGRLAWELDFWGRFRRAVDAADARLDASVEGYDNILVLLLAETAATYVDLRASETRLRYARHNVEIQAVSTDIANKRFDAEEKGAEIDAPQARANLAQTSAVIEELEIALRQAQNRLCVLMGIPPHDLAYLLDGDEESVIPVAPEAVVVEIPANLLRRRPDIRRAEREAAAQCEEIGIAVSELYPHISIDGSMGPEASSFEDLFRNSAFAGTVGPSFRWAVLNYGRLQGNVRVQDARFQQLVTRYQQTVLEANEEAENAMVAFLRFHNEEKLLLDAVSETQEAVRVLSVQYERGAIDFNRLVNLQQQLVQRQDQLAVVQGNIAKSMIQVYRAMGGGWEIRCSPMRSLQSIESPFSPEIGGEGGRRPDEGADSN